MKNLFSTILTGLLLLTSFEISAQTIRTGDEYRSKAQITLITPVGTNGALARYYTNDFSFNILAGVSQNERSFAFAGLANVIRTNAWGFQFAGLVNSVGGDVRGFQFGGLANVTGLGMRGVQFAGLGNIVGDDVTGFQFGGLLNVADDIDGFQFGGLANIVKYDVEGYQFGGLVNVTRSVEGFQFGGLGNVTDDVEGFQFGGLGNVTGDVDGFQFGGLFNVASGVRGVQFAGLVNVAWQSDYPIGLVNIIRDGEMSVGAGYNEIGTASVTFRSGGRVLYGILGGGFNHRIERRRDALSIVGGYGAHINIAPWFRINNEITCESIDIADVDSDTFKTGYSLLPAFRFGRFEIFGGPGIYYMQTDNERMYDLFPGRSIWEKMHTSGRLEQLFVGWQAGVQFVL